MRIGAALENAFHHYGSIKMNDLKLTIEPSFH